MITNVNGTPIESGENGLNKALDRERARYHERQAALLARVLRGTPKPAPGGPGWAGRRLGRPACSQAVGVQPG